MREHRAVLATDLNHQERSAKQAGNCVVVPNARHDPQSVLEENTRSQGLYYDTYYQFKVDVQAFDLVMEPRRYLHFSRADTDCLVSQHPLIYPSPAAVVPKKPTSEAS